MSQTLGQRRIRVSFNPASDSSVDTLKKATADLIDLVDMSAVAPNFTNEDVKDFNRLKALAMTAYEEAAMWATKMLTLAK